MEPGCQEAVSGISRHIHKATTAIQQCRGLSVPVLMSFITEIGSPASRPDDRGISRGRNGPKIATMARVGADSRFRPGAGYRDL